MHKQSASQRWLRQGVALEKRLDKMVAAGRLTIEEAERLRTATAGEREVLARAIQLRHARGRIDEAVEDGRLTEVEATVLSERLDNGDDLSLLRGIRRRRGGAD